jgi:hypothetical protein
MIRLIHSLGGCGGTLLSRCLGVLPKVALLSEINPASVKLFPVFDPLYQDRNWLHLLTEADAERFSQVDLLRIENFRDLIQLFYDRASAEDRHLVIRDYNYVDFIGAPFRTDPPGRLMLLSALPQRIPTASVALIRHPVDQWLSLRKHQVVNGLSPTAFCEGYETFLRELGATPVFQYEDFVANPEGQLRAICGELGLEFASSFKNRFHTYDCVTGDFTRLRDESISAPAVTFAPPEVMEEFRSSASFWWILGKTGYVDQDCRLKRAGAINGALSDAANEAERLMADVEKLTVCLKERDLRIAELEHRAAERLDALQRAEVVHRDTVKEAERRAADVEKLTAWLKERDLRIAELEHTAAERLDALQRAAVIHHDIATEAERRAADVEKLTAWLKERDLRIEETEHAATERLDALRRGQEILNSVSMQSDVLRRDLDESEAERLRNAAALTAFDDETLLHFLARRLKKRSP